MTTKSQHILLVDDEEAVVYVFSRYLERAGYRVTARHDPVEALAASEGVDMLVTDFRMPGMTGGSLIARLRERMPALPALIVTAYRAEIGMSAPGVPVLNKPIAPQELVDAVTRVLAARD